MMVEDKLTHEDVQDAVVELAARVSAERGVPVSSGQVWQVVREAAPGGSVTELSGVVAAMARELEAEPGAGTGGQAWADPFTVEATADKSAAGAVDRYLELAGRVQRIVIHPGTGDRDGQREPEGAALGAGAHGTVTPDVIMARNPEFFRRRPARADDRRGRPRRPHEDFLEHRSATGGAGQPDAALGGTGQPARGGQVNPAVRDLIERHKADGGTMFGAERPRQAPARAGRA